MKNVCLIQLLNPVMENTVITKFNIEYFRSGRTPLGVAYLAGTLLKNGHDAIIIDRAALHFQFDFKQEEVDKITVQKLLEYRPDIIGLSTVTGNFNDAIHTARMIRKLPGFKETTLVLGGYHATVETESALEECPDADAIIRGYAELTFLDFVNGKNPEEIAGITIRKQGNGDKFLTTPLQRQPRSLDHLAFPARHLLDMDYYTQPNSSAIPGFHMPSVTFVSSRGCPSRCRYCGADRMSQSVQAHSAEYVFKEIEDVISKYNISAIVFADHLFVASRRRTKEFCTRMIESGLNKHLVWTANSRADTVNEEMLELMKEAGCRWLCYGFETGSQRILDLANKNVKLEDYYKAAHFTKKSGIFFNASMIAGLPGETEEDFAKSVDFLNETKPFSAGFNLFTPLPGTYYYDTFLEQGILKKEDLDWHELGNLNVDKSKEYSDIPQERLRKLIHDANMENSIRTNLNYYKYNFLINPQGALIRLNYNGVKGDIESEKCYTVYRQALQELSIKKYEPALAKFSEALEARPCIMPCPCPGICTFYYDLHASICETLYESSQFEKLRKTCDHILSLPNLPFDLTPFKDYISECEKPSDSTSHERVPENSDLKPSQTKPSGTPVVTPEFKTWVSDKTMSSVFSHNCTTISVTGPKSQFGYLALSPDFQLQAGVYEFIYDVQLESGGVSVGLMNASNQTWIVHENHLASGHGKLSATVCGKPITARLVLSACNHNMQSVTNVMFSNLEGYRITGKIGARWAAVREKWIERKTENNPKKYFNSLRKMAAQGQSTLQKFTTNPKTVSIANAMVIDVADAGNAIQSILQYKADDGQDRILTADVGHNSVSSLALIDGRLGPRKAIRFTAGSAPMYLASVRKDDGRQVPLLCFFNFDTTGESMPHSSVAILDNFMTLEQSEAINDVAGDWPTLFKRSGHWGYRGIHVLQDDNLNYAIASVDRDKGKFHLLTGKPENGRFTHQEKIVNIGVGTEPIGVNALRTGNNIYPLNANYYISSRNRNEIVVVGYIDDVQLRIKQRLSIDGRSRSSVAVGRFWNKDEYGVAVALWGGDPTDLNAFGIGQIAIARVSDDGTLVDLKYIEAGVHPTDIASGDLDGDGVDELVVLNYGVGLGPADRAHPGSVQIFKYTDGAFRCLSEIKVPNPRIACITDIDGDEIDELLVSLFFENMIVTIKSL